MKKEAVKVHYDTETNTLTITLRDSPVAESVEDKPGVILDYDDQGNLVSVELLDASQACARLPCWSPCSGSGRGPEV